MPQPTIPTQTIPSLTAAAQTTPRRFTLPGQGVDGACPISIDLDDTNAEGGQPISYDLFQQLVTNYHNQVDIKDRPHEKVAYIIDRQLLQILLSSKNCTGLLLSKCLRIDDAGNKTESIAFMALDNTLKPVGTVINNSSGRQTTLLADAASEVAAGEWIHGLTVDEEVRAGIINPIAAAGNGFNFQNFLETIVDKNKALL